MRSSEMIRARARREPAFQEALYQECVRELHDGNPTVAEHMMREYLEMPETGVRQIMADVSAKTG